MKWKKVDFYLQDKETSQNELLKILYLVKQWVRFEPKSTVSCFKYSTTRNFNGDSILEAMLIA